MSVLVHVHRWNEIWRLRNPQSDGPAWRKRFGLDNLPEKLEIAAKNTKKKQFRLLCHHPTVLAKDDFRLLSQDQHRPICSSPTDRHSETQARSMPTSARHIPTGRWRQISASDAAWCVSGHPRSSHGKGGESHYWTIRDVKSQPESSFPLRFPDGLFLCTQSFCSRKMNRMRPTVCFKPLGTGTCSGRCIKRGVLSPATTWRSQKVVITRSASCSQSRG